MQVLEYLSKQSKPFLIGLGFILIICLGIIDYLTGPELAFSIFYLIPVSMVAWLVGQRAGVVISIASAALWLFADLPENVYTNPAIPYWNALVRLSFFLIVTYTLSALRTAQARQEELAHFIVHDLRSPLSNVMTGLETLQEIEEENGEESTHQKLIEVCLTSCKRMLTLINSLLDLARLESGQLPLQLSEVEVKELVEASLKQVDWWAERNQVTLTADLNTNIVSVHADPVLTERILVNLLSNAIKFSCPETAVTLRVAPADATMIAFSVSDHGRGIPQEWAGRVFDKFAQVDARKAGKSLGSGLGLTFCRLAVEAQGGRISLASEIDQGTTVTFTLPRKAR